MTATPAPGTQTPAQGTGATSRREQRRLLHQDLSRTQLLDAAEEVFGEKGFHDTTLREIAELAEFSVGSVYSFFENKDDLYLHVFLRRGAQFMPGLEAVAAGEGTAADQLHALVDYEVGFFRSHPHFARLYLRSAGTILPGPDVPSSPALSANFARAMDIHAEVFARGQEAGLLRPGDPVVLARMLSGIIFAYQSVDPAVVGAAGGALPLEGLHEIVDGAFGR